MLCTSLEHSQMPQSCDRLLPEAVQLCTLSEAMLITWEALVLWMVVLCVVFPHAFVLNSVTVDRNCLSLKFCL